MNDKWYEIVRIYSENGRTTVSLSEDFVVTVVGLALLFIVAKWVRG